MRRIRSLRDGEFYSSLVFGMGGGMRGDRG